MTSNALLDKNFLLELDQYRHKTVYVRIVSLNFDEDPVAEITGNVTGGSISVDGSSSVRRTCNLTLVTNATRISEVDWALRTKFQVMIGLENHIDDRYDKIIWFPQGTYVISSFSSQLNGQGYQINISGKDKMCLLNGDVGGQMFAAHEFSTIYTTHNDGTITKDKIPIKTIIRDAVHTYAQEPYSNIIINDLEDCGVELIDYTCDDSKMYIFEQRKNDTDPWVSQICFEGSFMADLFEHYSTQHNEKTWDFYMDDNNVHYHLLKRIDPKTDIDTTAGYRATDLTYPEDLVVSIGGNITQMLDNIVKMLGEFEYFYDVQGRFVFQRKKIYFNSSWSSAITNDGETYYDLVANSSAVAYNFMSGYLIESFQNKPNLNAIRNDYSVWGKRKSGTGIELPIHLRYAIDARPTTYWSLLEKRLYMSNAYRYEMITGYQEDETGAIKYDQDGHPLYNVSIITGKYDWRELIYQMARDNLRANTMINALTLALAKGYYHYDEYKMNQYGQEHHDYRSFLRYDDILGKFKHLSITQPTGANDKKESDTQEPYYGQTEYEQCVKNNIPLFGQDASLAQWVVEEKDIPFIEQYMREGKVYSDELGQWVSTGRAYPTYSYRTNNYQMQYLNIFYDGTLSASQKQAAIAELREMQADEKTVISYFTRGNIIEDMRREIDEWSDTFKTGYDAYYADMLQFWPLLYRSENVTEFMYDDNGKIALDDEGNPTLSANSLSIEEWQKWTENHYWNPDLMVYDDETESVSFKNPELLQFWLEFIEQDQEPALWQYSVSMIGRRSKSINDDKVKAIYFRDTPLLLFQSEDYEPVEGEENLNYVRINLAPPISNYFRISSQGKSAKSVMDGLLYDGTYYQESITVNSIPIYYLEPNIRIEIQDDATGINGQYLVKSFSLQLNHDGMMSITATRVTEAIL